MKDVERYLQAGTRENTRRSYQSAVEHFEVTWGGFLPATSDSIVRYLVDYADTLSLNTLKQRLAALAQWHIRHGFPDPTKTPTVHQVLKGIRTLHPSQTKQAAPLQLQHLEHAVEWLEQEAMCLFQAEDLAGYLRCRRDTVRIPRHSDTQPTLIRTPVPRSFGQAVGAQRRRGGIVSPGWLASSISASVCALIHPSD